MFTIIIFTTFRIKVVDRYYHDRVIYLQKKDIQARVLKMSMIYTIAMKKTDEELCETL